MFFLLPIGEADISSCSFAPIPSRARDECAMFFDSLTTHLIVVAGIQTQLHSPLLRIISHSRFATARMCVQWSGPFFAAWSSASIRCPILVSLP
jgi:hypothetical protein